MKKFINTTARSFAPIMVVPGEGPSMGERLRAFLVKVTDERPELFKNDYLMHAAERLREIYPILDIEKFYEYKKSGHDRIFDAYERSLRAFISTGDPKSALKALRPQDVEIRDKIHRMVQPEHFDQLGGCDGIYEVLVEVDLMAGSSLGSFLVDADELLSLHQDRYQIIELLKDLNISVETREDFEVVMSNMDMLRAQKQVQAVAKQLSTAVSRFVKRNELDLVKPKEMRGYFEARSEERNEVCMTPATLALPDLPGPCDLSTLIERLSCVEEINIADIRNIMDTHAGDLSLFTEGAESFEDLLAHEQESMKDFLAGMDASRLHGELGRLPYADEEVDLERSTDGMILRARIIEDASPSIEI
ncbi:hypothetical protein LCGC14_0042980 [marine sediment metagenome]|uniref:Uncharacterized protein n=2 Tax=root TaxID=1 RepID=A0A7V1BIC5_9RHOB|nr:hypothetical protein [Sulfitobacter litoralis]HDZ53360.1 hypothetical protein [Sulfitobacter litoralis]